MPTPPVTAVIPLKALTEAKGRLAPALSAERRRALVEEMFLHVLVTCSRAQAVEAILVVAGDRAGADLAAGAGARAVVPARPGLRVALEHADTLVGGSAASLVVAADLPLLTVADLEAVCSAGGAGATVVVAPTWDGGTGALLRRPTAVIPTAYGPSSAAAHIALAAGVGIAAAIVEREGLSFDVDTIDQLTALRERRPTAAGARRPPSG